MGKKILVIRLGSLGDIILTSPAVINLKIAHPDSQLTYLCKEQYRPVVAMMDGVDAVVTVPDRVKTRSYLRQLLDLDRDNYDMVVDLHGNIRSWLARKTITAVQTTVYPKRRVQRLLSVKRKVIPEIWPHTIDLYNGAVEKLGFRPYSRRPVLKVDRPCSDDLVGNFFEANPEYIVVAPGAAHPNKQWPPECFAEVADRLRTTHGLAIVWALTAADEENKHLGDGTGPSSLRLVEYPVPQLATVIARSTVTISNDSGIAHLSSAVGTPVVAVFGPTHPALGFSPRGMFDEVAEVDESCRPCSLHGKKPCYREQRFCFDRISVDSIVETVERILDRQNNLAPAVFVDRDGTVIVDKNFLIDPDDIEFEAGSVAALRLLQSAGFKIVIISNQSGVARGFFSIDEVDRANACLLELLAAEHIDVDAVYYCPHHPHGSVNEYTMRCDCRKPGPAMVEDAAYQLGLDLRNSYVIGDKIDDVNLGKVVGATPVLVETGYGQRDRRLLETAEFYSDVFIADNLLAAARRIAGDRTYD